MKGLLKNNLYTTLTNAKIFSAVMALFGIIVVTMSHKVPELIINYILAVMIGFSFNSLENMYKENSSKWLKYKLTAPVRRADIVKSFFISQLLWLIVGSALSGTIIILSVLLHGYPFDRNTDIFMLFVVGIGISLFMTAFFIPLFFLSNEERAGICLVLSVFFSIGIILGLIVLLNALFPSPMNTLQIILAGASILVCAVLAFILSYLLTVRIFNRKEY